MLASDSSGVLVNFAFNNACGLIQTQGISHVAILPVWWILDVVIFTVWCPQMSWGC